MFVHMCLSIHGAESPESKSLPGSPRGVTCAHFPSDLQLVGFQEVSARITSIISSTRNPTRNPSSDSVRS